MYSHGHLRVEKFTRMNRIKFFDPQKAMTVPNNSKSHNIDISKIINYEIRCKTAMHKIT